MKWEENYLVQKELIQVLKRASEILSSTFENDDTWIRIIIWNRVIETLPVEFKLGHYDFLIRKSEFQSLKHNKTNSVLYVRYKSFRIRLVKNLIKSIATREIEGISSDNKDLEDISVYFVKFGKNPTVVNLYDDRGLDIIQKNQPLLEKAFSRYKYAIQSK